MSRLRVLMLIGLLFAPVACSTPVLVNVTVEVEEPSVDSVEIFVRRDAPEPADILRCRLAMDGTLNEDCGFEEPAVRWMGDDSLRFVLYGSPATGLTVRVVGWAAGVEVSNATSKVTLSEGPPLENTLRLLPKTFVKRRCEARFADPDGGAAVVSLIALNLTRAAGGRLDILASSAGTFGRATYRAGLDESCQLDLTVIREGCLTQPGGLVVGDLSMVPGDEWVLTCGNLREERDGAINFVRAGQGVYATHPWNRFHDSLPVVLDVGGSTRAETIVVRTEVSGPMGQQVGSLHYDFYPGETPQPSESRQPCQVPARTAGVRAPFPPMGWPQRQRDGVVLAGYGPGVLYATTSTCAFHRVDNLGNYFISPSVFAGIGVQNRIAAPTFRQMAVANGELRLGNVLNPGNASYSFQPTDLDPSDRTLGVSMAFGALTAGPVVRGVFVADATMFLTTMPCVRDCFTDVELDVPTRELLGVRLANIDHLPGSEVIAFERTGHRIWAFDGDGDPIAGFPIENVGVSGQSREVVLSDLDGDGALEIVVLSAGKLEVISLGPSSYDPAALPWPMNRGDRQNSGVFRGNADPVRTSTST